MEEPKNHIHIFYLLKFIDFGNSDVYIVMRTYFVKITRAVRLLIDLTKNPEGCFIEFDEFEDISQEKDNFGSFPYLLPLLPKILSGRLTTFQENKRRDLIDRVNWVNIRLTRSPIKIIKNDISGAKSSQKSFPNLFENLIIDEDDKEDRIQNNRYDVRLLGYNPNYICDACKIDMNEAEKLIQTYINNDLKIWNELPDNQDDFGNEEL